MVLRPAEVCRRADFRLPADLRHRRAVLALLDDERLLRVRNLARLHPIPFLSQPEKRSGELRLQMVHLRGSDHFSKKNPGQLPAQIDTERITLEIWLGFMSRESLRSLAR